MKIVIDTNIVISGLFFGGIPAKVLSAVVLNANFTACASPEIIEEYKEVVREMYYRKHSIPDETALSSVVNAMEIVEPVSMVEICRDPDDDKFIACAKDAAALYIVSGDADLLVLEKVENIKIITAKEFCEKYLSA